MWEVFITNFVGLFFHVEKLIQSNVCVQRKLLFYSGVIKMISMYACFKSVQPSRVKQFLDFMPLPKYDFLLHHFFVLELCPLIYWSE